MRLVITLHSLPTEFEPQYDSTQYDSKVRQHSDSTPTAPTAPTIDSSDSSDRVRQHYDSKNARDHVYTLS